MIYRLRAAKFSELAPPRVRRMIGGVRAHASARREGLQRQQGAGLADTWTVQRAWYCRRRLPRDRGAKKSEVLAHLERWHQRFVHLNTSALMHLLRDGRVRGVEIAVDELGKLNSKMHCVTCNLAKAKGMSHRSVAPRRLMPASSEPSQSGRRCTSCWPSTRHRATCGGPSAGKKRGFGNGDTARDFVACSRKGVGLVGLDQGREFLSRLAWCSYELTNSYSPEEKALVKKKNGIVMTKVWALLVAAGMPDTLWGEAFNFVVDVKNVSPTKVLNGGGGTIIQAVRDGAIPVTDADVRNGGARARGEGSACQQARKPTPVGAVCRVSFELAWVLASVSSHGADRRTLQPSVL
ncbi:hypothetical protein PybrP1_013057 [[Pythium] brassicae (nom. inval.)]|nr:hypothetical protein PybrP1_013057 [[Pythium] brassicae (nom. inval.)]